jgi:hypothetical protein
VQLLEAIEKLPMLMGADVIVRAVADPLVTVKVLVGPAVPAITDPKSTIVGVEKIVSG